MYSTIGTVVTEKSRKKTKWNFKSNKLVHVIITSIDHASPYDFKQEHN